MVLPDNANPSGITPLVQQTLGPDHALFVDCYTSEAASISSQLSSDGITAPTTEFEGFVVIAVPQPRLGTAVTLDVEGKYTARPGSSNGSPSDVSSLQVQVYHPTFVRYGSTDR